MKSSLSTVGAMELSETAMKLETASKNGDINYCLEKFPRFRERLFSLHERLSVILPSAEAVCEKKQGDSVYLHENIQKALEAGKHVVVEKPFTHTVKQGEILLNIADKRKKILSVFQNRRWDGDFLTVRKIVENEWLGRLVEFESFYMRYRNFIQPNTWKESASQGIGLTYNLGSHMIDQAVVLFGMPESVWADIDSMRAGSEIDDYYNIKLFYPDIKVSLKASYLVREEGPRYTLHGTNGSFLKYGIDPQEEMLKQGGNPSMPNWGKEPEAQWGILNTELNGIHFRGKVETVAGNYSAYYDNIYNAIRKHTELEVMPEQALNVLHIIEAAIESSHSGHIIDF